MQINGEYEVIDVKKRKIQLFFYKMPPNQQISRD